METIEPDIQDAILDILPNDGPLAMRLMRQLLANMILSLEGSSINDVIELIRLNLAEYEGT